MKSLHQWISVGETQVVLSLTLNSWEEVKALHQWISVGETQVVLSLTLNSWEEVKALHQCWGNTGGVKSYIEQLGGGEGAGSVLLSEFYHDVRAVLI